MLGLTKHSIPSKLIQILGQGMLRKQFFSTPEVSPILSIFIPEISSSQSNIIAYLNFESIEQGPDFSTTTQQTIIDSFSFDLKTPTVLESFLDHT